MGSLTLKQSYDLAVLQSERLKILHEQLVQADAQAKQALGGVLPHVDWEFNDLIQDTSQFSSSSNSISGVFDQREQIENKISLQQALFHGLREWSAYKGFLKQQQSDYWRGRCLDTFNAFRRALRLQPDGAPGKHQARRGTKDSPARARRSPGGEVAVPA